MSKDLNRKKTSFATAAFFFVGITSAGVYAHANDRTAKARATAPVTAQDQAQTTQSEVDVTQRIRQRLNAVENLSTRAKNVLIVTRDGSVYLQGPVASTAESTRVESVAKEVAGTTRVINELTVQR